MNNFSTLLSQESRWPTDRRRRIISALVILVGVLYLCTPRLTGWSFEHLHKEDGLIFLSDYLRDGWGSVFQTYTGYLHVGPRLITGMCANAVSPELFSTCVGGSVAVVRGLIAVVSLGVFLPYAKNFSWALAASVVVLFLGVGQQEVLGNLTNLRWFLDVAGLIVLFGNFRRPTLAIMGALLGILAATSDPLALVFLPIAVWRIFTLKGWGRTAPVAFLAGSLLHITFLNTGARRANWSVLYLKPAEFVDQVLIRGPVEAVFGENGTQLGLYLVGPFFALLALVIPAAVIFIGWKKAPKQSRILVVTLITFGLAILSATILFASFDDIMLANPGAVKQVSRYALFPAVVIAQALVLLTPWAIQSGKIGRIFGWLMIVCMLGAAAADSIGTPWNSKGPVWSDTVHTAREVCLLQPDRESVVVRVTPLGVPFRWTATVTCDWLKK